MPASCIESPFARSRYMLPPPNTEVGRFTYSSTSASSPSGLPQRIDPTIGAETEPVVHLAMAGEAATRPLYSSIPLLSISTR